MLRLTLKEKRLLESSPSLQSLTPNFAVKRVKTALPKMQKSLRCTTPTQEQFDQEHKLLAELRGQIAFQGKDLEVRAKIIKDLQRDFEKLTSLLIEERNRVTELTQELSHAREKLRSLGFASRDNASLVICGRGVTPDHSNCSHAEAVIELQNEMARLTDEIVKKVRYI